MVYIVIPNFTSPMHCIASIVLVRPLKMLTPDKVHIIVANNRSSTRHKGCACIASSAHTCTSPSFHLSKREHGGHIHMQVIEFCYVRTKKTHAFELIQVERGRLYVYAMLVTELL